MHRRSGVSSSLSARLVPILFPRFAQYPVLSLVLFSLAFFFGAAQDICDASSPPNAVQGCPSTAVGGVCELLQCMIGYVPNSPECQSPGIWSPAPACTPLGDYCSATSGSQYASMECAASAIGSTCTLTCQTGYKQVAAATCTAGGSSEPGAGLWSPVPACTAVVNYCSGTLTANAQNDCPPTTMGQECSLTCRVGYIASVPVCSAGATDAEGDGIWSPDPRCDPVSNYCSGTANIPNSVNQCLSRSTGALCTGLQCAAGYTRPSTIVCSPGADNTQGAGI